MHHRPRRSWGIPLLIALLSADLVLGVIFGALYLGRPGASAARETAPPSPGPATPAAQPGRSTPPGTPAALAAAPVASPTPPATATPATTPLPATATPSPRPSPPALAPNPLISRGKPVAASPDVATPAAAVDGHYCAPPAWRTTTFPSWLAIRIGAGPSRLLLSWNSDADNYVDFEGKPVPGIPASYTIETSADSTNGADGAWQVVVRVTGNTARTRAHSFAFAGAAWVRMTVTAVPRGTGGAPLSIDEIDVHDLSRGSADTIFFMGDSITAAAFLRCDRLQPSFAALVHQAWPDYFPALINGGVAGVSSDWGMEQMDRWLADNPDYRVWAIAYGTNDAYRERPSPVFEQQLQTLIDKAKAAGKEPVLARIPHTTNALKDQHVQRLNGIIDELTRRNGLRPGPDLYAWFKNHPDQLASDGVHVTIEGSRAINRLWYEALRTRYTAGGR
jgi:acyl-CoA thioesterase-1